MAARYIVRPDAEGFRVTDIWTGQPASLAMTPQTGLSLEDAEHTAALLNDVAAEDDIADA